MPPASSTSAADATSAGTSGLSWTPWMKDAVSAPIRTEPASAVPRDAPRLVAVFCRPPTSPLSSSGTDETVTAPSWDASAPDAETGQEQRHGDDLGTGPGLERRDEGDDAGQERGQPPVHDLAR